MSVTVRSREIVGSALAPAALRLLQTNVSDAQPSNAIGAWIGPLADAGISGNASLLPGTTVFASSGYYVGSVHLHGYLSICCTSYAQAVATARVIGDRGRIQSLAGVLSPLCANAGSPLLEWAETALTRSKSAQTLIDRINKFQKLPVDWDGDGTVIVSDEVVGTAIAIIDALEYADLELPQSSPSAEGDIGLNWYNGSNTLEMTILADGHVVWVTDIDDRVEPGRDVRVVSLLFPSIIIEAVRGFYTKVSSSMPL